MNKPEPRPRRGRTVSVMCTDHANAVHEQYKLALGMLKMDVPLSDVVRHLRKAYKALDRQYRNRTFVRMEE